MSRKWFRDFDKGTGKVSDSQMKKDYDKMYKETTPQPGDYQPAPRMTIYPDKKKKRM